MSSAQDVDVTSGSAPLAVRHGGDRSGPALLWLHGYTMDSSLWQQIWQLMPRWHHVAVDLPGHGDSAPIPPGLSLDALADTVAGVAADHQARHCVALCFGSCVALQWAIRHPESVDQLSIAAPTLGGVLAEPEAAARYKQLAMLKRFAGPGEQMAGLWMSSPPNIFRGVSRYPEAAERVRQVLTRHRWDELVSGAMGRLTGSVQTPEMLGGIRTPLQVIVGTEDLDSMLVNAATLQAAVGTATVHRLDGVGHLPPIEVPTTVAPLLGAFFGFPGDAAAE
ncbi:alpha/beta fold hydrolase [Nakamurella aerolata]|uniref:Alpha/beta fold hydrolase n=1 Tax=Nakamurella aerolata TaxID=1656892 RepID=A0A849AKV3_9ACTN|nr:alpha/beta fold hydrolase [Nakamurella aerolata]NNG37452.1 alpha/beta fold hydrolase [Nakamurella aerolata]